MSHPLAQFFYFAGLPYLAVILGLITPRLLGLKGLEHVALVDWSGGQPLLELQQALTLLGLELLLDTPPMLMSGTTTILIFVVVLLCLNYQGMSLTSPHLSTLTVIYYALHWAFYRAICWSITDDLYLGVVWGSATVIIEAGLSRWVQGCSLLDQTTLLHSLMLILTATAFFYTPNLWLLMLLHLLLAAIINLNLVPTTIRT